MTTDHPDDELLSALLDRESLPSDGASSGPSSEELTGHVATCLDCQGRLAKLAEVAAAVAAPVPPPMDAVREAAISAALAIQGSSDQEVGEVDHRVVVHAERRFARGRQLASYLGAAAIVLALLAAVPLLARGSGSTKATTSAAAVPSGVAASGTTVAGAAAQAPSTSAAFGQSVTNGVANDLGPQSDAAGLASSIGQHLALSQAAATAPLSSDKSGAATPTSAAPTDLAARAAATCEPVAAGYFSAGATTPLYSAALTWRGTAAEVFAFSTPAGRRAVVLSRTGCLVLETLSL